jgi:ABC-2 type transport system ATP-binding protein
MEMLLDAPPVSVRDLTKVYDQRAAVDHLSFSVAPGRVTGFLGPNGAGKTTTLRMLVGLAAPTSGEALVFGRPYRELPVPTALVGTLIDASGFHPGRRARHELAIHAAAAGVGDDRIPVVLHEVGLEAAGDKRVGQLSLGMRQRLGLAAALLGTPSLLLLDEPANGLDPAGMHWLRGLLRSYADRGTAVLVSSHVLAELAQFADDVVVVNHGRLVTQAAVADLLASHGPRVLVRSPQAAALRDSLVARGATVALDGAGADALVVTGLPAAAVGDLAAAEGVALHQLQTEIQSLEDAFLELTHDEEGIR